MLNQNIDNNIKVQFVDSLMNYFKMKEDPFLRAHVNDLIRDINIDSYQEFLRRLSDGNYAFKNACERIALVAKSFQEKEQSKLFEDVSRRVKQLYDISYDLYMKLSSEKDALEKFVNISFMSINIKDSGKKIFDDLDERVIRSVTKEWIFKSVCFDKSLFFDTLEHEYKNAIIEQQRDSEQAQISNTTRAQIEGSF